MALVLVRSSRQTARNTQGQDGEDDYTAPAECGDEELAGEFLRRGSNVLRIESAWLTYKEKANLLIKERDPNLISRDVLTKVVKDRRRRFYGCLSLPFSILFFLMFATSTILHEDTTATYILESGLVRFIGEGSKDVESIPEVWSWIQNHLEPILFERNKTIWPAVLTYNMLTGPLLMEQLRSEKASCSRGGIDGMTCYPQETKSTEPYGRIGNFYVTQPSEGEYSGGNVSLAERTTYWESAFSSDKNGASGRRLRTLRPEYAKNLPGGKTSEGDFKAVIYPNTPKPVVDRYLAYLHERGWLDEQSKKLIIKMLLLNAEFGRPRLEQIKVSFYFSRAGGVFSEIAMETVFLKYWSGVVSILADLGWVGCLIFITANQCWGLKRDKDATDQHKQVTDQHKDSGAFWKKVRDPWSLLQWAIVMIGWVYLLMSMLQFQKISTLYPTYEQIVAHQAQDLPMETVSSTTDLHVHVDSMAETNKYLRGFAAFYHLLLMIRFFAAFNAQPRLGVVVSALEASLVDIIHFLVVVLPTFLAYTISGVFIFGRRMEDFSSLEAAFGVCFKIFMEGEYDWPDLAEEHFWTAGIWCWSFMIFLCMIMLNLVLAIVLDVYKEIRTRTDASEPVWTTMRKMGQQLAQRLCRVQSWISDQEIESKLMELPHLGPELTRKDLEKAFPEMSEEQMDMLMEDCKTHNALAEHNSEKDAMKLAMSVQLVMDKISETAELLDEGALGDEDAERSRRNGWMADIAQEMSQQNHLMLAVQWQLQQLEWQWRALEAVHGPQIGSDRGSAIAEAKSKIL